MIKPMTFEQVDHFNEQMDAAQERGHRGEAYKLCKRWNVAERLPKSVSVADLVFHWKGTDDHSFTRNYFVI